MTKMLIRLKSGYEIPIECDEFTIEKNGRTQEMESIDIKGIKDNRPVFFRLEDVDCIIEKIDRKNPAELTWR